MSEKEGMIYSPVRMWKTVRTSEKPQFGFGEALGLPEYLLKALGSSKNTESSSIPGRYWRRL